MLALLQEVAQFPDVKLDWNALVKKTSTGISNAREYQMLWRHLAYRNTLFDKLEDNAQPLVNIFQLPFPDASFGLFLCVTEACYLVCVNQVGFRNF